MGYGLILRQLSCRWLCMADFFLVFLLLAGDENGARWALFFCLLVGLFGIILVSLAQISTPCMASDHLEELPVTSYELRVTSYEI